MNIKIAIADDHNLIVEGITKMLSPYTHIEFTESYASGRRLLHGLQQALPDVLLLDLHFPDTTGNELIRQIKPLYPELKILVISSVEDPFEIKDMIRQGALGYVQKTISAEMLVQAIETVYYGEPFIQSRIKEIMADAVLSQTRAGAPDLQLSPREQSMLEMICNGLSSIEIGEKLFLSNRTVEGQRMALYQKFGVSNTASLVKMAVLLKFVK